MPFITRPKDGFFRVSMTNYEYLNGGEQFVAEVKEWIKPEDRDYDDHDHEWVFGDEKYQLVRTLLRQTFIEGVEEE